MRVDAPRPAPARAATTTRTHAVMHACAHTSVHGRQVILGEPICFGAPEPDPSARRVEEVHAEYFRRVHAMFERHKHECGFGDAHLEFMDAKKPKSGGRT